MTIYEKLSAVQANLKAPKNQRNNFGGYNYRSCEDILEAAKPILRKNGLTLTITDTIKQIGDRYYIAALATVYDLESGKRIMASAYAREEETKKGMDAAQITGSASSYARKYALNGLFNIDDSKIEASPDPDTQPRPEPKMDWICADCGQEIKAAEIEGTTYPADFIMRISQKRHGLNLCAKCLTARRATSGDESNED